MLMILVFSFAAVILIKTGFDVSVGAGCIAVAFLLLIKKFKESSMKYSFVDSIDGRVLTCIMGFWIELSILLRTYLYCWFGYNVPLSNYEQLSFAFDVLFIEYFPEGYEACKVIRWAIIITVLLTFVCLKIGKRQAIMMYEIIDQNEVDEFLKQWLPVLDTTRYDSIEYENAYNQIAYFCADRLYKGIGKAAEKFVFGKAYDYQHPSEYDKCLGETVVEIISRRHEIWKTSRGIE